MPSASQIAAVMAEMDNRNRQPATAETTSHVKSMPAMNLTGLRAAMAGVLPGGWSSDHAAETEKFAGWHYIAIHAIYKQVIQAGVEVYERKLIVPDLQKPQEAPPAPAMNGQPGAAVPKMPGAFTKGFNEQQESMHPVPHYDPVMKRLKKPNPAQTLSTFNGERAIQLALTGRAITWNVKSQLTGKIIERYVIPTCLAQPRPPSRELPRGGWYVLPEGARYAQEAGFYMVGTLEAAFGKIIPAEDVQIIKFPHPKFKDDGQSPVSASALWTDTSEMVDKSRHNHLKNGPDPSVVIGLDGEVDETSIRRGEAIFNERYAGVDKHGKAMFVTPAKTITPLTTAPKDMAYGDGFTQLRDAQLAVHGVPLAAVGLTSPTGREGLYAPLLQFTELSVQPILKLLGDEDSALYSSDEGREIEIVYTVKKFNDEELLEKQIQTDIQAGVLTKGELRKMRGRDLFGDERDEELCGSQAASAGQPMIGPDGQPIGPDGMPLPESSNPEAAANLAKPSKQPMGRAMQSIKPRLANQIAKAFAKELEKYGIFKGGPGSGNHGHCGGEGGDGHPGGSRPADECGNTTQSNTVASGNATENGSQPPQAQSNGGGRLGEVNPHAFGIPPAIRRQLSAAAFAAAAEDFGGGTIDEDRERATVQQIASSIQGREGSIGNQVAIRHAEDFYRQERDIARGIFFGGGREARARASDTQNLYGISQDEAMAHLQKLETGNFVGTRVSLLIQSTNRAINVGGHASQAEGEANLARVLASEQLAEPQIVQAINLLRGMRGTDWSNIEPGDAARIAVNAIAGYQSNPQTPEPTQPATEFERREQMEPLRYPEDGKIQREYKPRVAPEPIDGTAVKESKILTDVRARAKEVKFADGDIELEKSIDEERLREELIEEGLYAYEYDDDKLSAIAERAVDGMKNRVNSYADLPQQAVDSIDSFLDELAGNVGSSDDITDKTVEFFDTLEDDIDGWIEEATEGDEEAAKELRGTYDDVRSDFIDEAKIANQRFSDMLSDSQVEWAQQYADDMLDERISQMKEEGGDYEAAEPNTWYQGGDEAKLKLVTRKGSEFHLVVTDSNGSSEYGLPSGAKLGDMVFTDKSGSIEITKKGKGEQFEVFRGVSAALLAKMDREGYDAITYTAIEEKRQEVYDRLTQTIAQYDGKYVAAVIGGSDANSRNRSAQYVVVKREHKEKLQEYLEGKDKHNWLVKRYWNGTLKTFGNRTIRWYDYSKGGPGSGNHGHCGGEGGAGNPGGSKPADQCGGDTVTYISRGKEVTDRATGETMEVVAGKEVEITKIDWNDKDVEGRERYLSLNQNLTEFIKKQGHDRSAGTRMDLVDFAKELDEVAVYMPLYEDKTIIKDNVERAGEILADMTLEADAIDPSWPKWYSEIEQVTEELQEEDGEFNLSDKSRELLKTKDGKALFIGVLAITSQKASPAGNLVSTKNLYDYYAENGKLPTSDSKLKEMIKSESYEVIGTNIKTYQSLIDTLGSPEKAFEFLNKEVTVRKLEQVAKSAGIKFSSSVAFKGQVVPVSYIFGPKIGAFHANLGGIEDLLTQDRWLTRTMNRISGRIGFSREQVMQSWSDVAQFKPTKENAKKVGLTVAKINSAVKTLAKGGEVDDSTMAALSKLAALHISSGPKSANKEIIRDDFTTALNTADKKTKDVVNSPGSALSRTANQLAAEHAVRVLKSRGKPFSVREVQAAVWMLEKARWYEAGVGNKRGFANSYLSVLREARKAGIAAILKNSASDDED